MWEEGGLLWMISLEGRGREMLVVKSLVQDTFESGEKEIIMEGLQKVLFILLWMQGGEDHLLVVLGQLAE